MNTLLQSSNGTDIFHYRFIMINLLSAKQYVSKRHLNLFSVTLLTLANLFYFHQFLLLFTSSQVCKNKFVVKGYHAHLV